MFPLDREVFRWINGWPDAWEPFFVFLSTGIDEAPVRVALGLLLLGMMIWKRTRTGALVGGLLWPIANAATDVIKATWSYPRPPGVLEDVIARVGISESMGTASAHAANNMFIAMAFTLAWGWRGAPWLLLPLFVGISRVYVGAHFPAQVLLGWLVGAFCAFVAWHTVRAYLHLRKKGEDPSPPTPAEAPEG